MYVCVCVRVGGISLGQTKERLDDIFVFNGQFVSKTHMNLGSMKLLLPALQKLK